MQPKFLSSRLLIIGGSIEISIALLHFIWPFSFINTGSFSSLNQQSKDLIMLCCIGVGLCMAVFGALSFYFATKIKEGEKSAIVFSASQAVVWILRLILELLFPVRIPIYFITSPSILIVIGAIILIAVYLVPVRIGREGKESLN